MSAIRVQKPPSVLLCFCAGRSVSVQDDLFLCRTVCFCAGRSVSVQDGLFLCRTVCFCAGRSACIATIFAASEKEVRKKETVDKRHKCDVANVGLNPIFHTDVPLHCTKNLITQKPDKVTGSLA